VLQQLRDISIDLHKKWSKTYCKQLVLKRICKQTHILFQLFGHAKQLLILILLYF